MMAPGQVAAVADMCDALERRLGCRPGALQLEIMVETPQSILGADGTSVLPRSSRPASGRVAGAHFGTYDYTALCDITARIQHMRHPACDFAQAHDAGRAGADRRAAVGRRDQHHAGRAAPRRRRATAHRQQQQREPRRGASRVAAALRRRPPLARQRLLPGLGPASGAAADALRGGLRVLPSARPRRHGAGCATSSTRRRRPRSSATCSTTRRPVRGCSTSSCAA